MAETKKAKKKVAKKKVAKKKVEEEVVSKPAFKEEFVVTVRGTVMGGTKQMTQSEYDEYCKKKD